MQKDVDDDNMIEGTVQKSVSGGGITELQFGNRPKDFAAFNQCEDGYIKFFNTWFPVIFSDLSDPAPYRIRINGEYDFTGVGFSLVDDDYRIVSGQTTPSGAIINGTAEFKVKWPHDPDTTKLKEAFKPAYVLPVLWKETPDGDIGFDRNVEKGSELASVARKDFQFENLLEPCFWGCHLVSGFQGFRRAPHPDAGVFKGDNDPEDESQVQLGVTSERSAALVYKESIRDIQNPEANVVLHEVGHCAGATHKPDFKKDVMRSPKKYDFFSAWTLREIRDYEQASN